MRQFVPGTSIPQEAAAACFGVQTDDTGYRRADFKAGLLNYGAGAKHYPKLDKARVCIAPGREKVPRAAACAYPAYFGSARLHENRQHRRAACYSKRRHRRHRATISSRRSSCTTISARSSEQRTRALFHLKRYPKPCGASQRITSQQTTRQPRGSTKPLP